MLVVPSAAQGRQYTNSSTDQLICLEINVYMITEYCNIDWIREENIKIYRYWLYPKQKKVELFWGYSSRSVTKFCTARKPSPRVASGIERFSSTSWHWKIALSFLCFKNCLLPLLLLLEYVCNSLSWHLNLHIFEFKSSNDQGISIYSFRSWLCSILIAFINLSMLSWAFANTGEGLVCG